MEVLLPESGRRYIAHYALFLRWKKCTMRCPTGCPTWYPMGCPTCKRALSTYCFRRKVGHMSVSQIGSWNILPKVNCHHFFSVCILILTSWFCYTGGKVGGRAGAPRHILFSKASQKIPSQRRTTTAPGIEFWRNQIEILPLNHLWLWRACRRRRAMSAHVQTSGGESDYCEVGQN